MNWPEPRRDRTVRPPRAAGPSCASSRRRSHTPTTHYVFGREARLGHFGVDTLRVIEEQPARLVEVPGLGPKRTAMIGRAWEEQKAIKEVMVFLQGVGVSTSLAVRIYKTYGDGSISIVRNEPYRLAADVAPLVDKIRYNPGHLYHHEPNRPWQEKVRFLVDVAVRHDCAIRVGVNCGSVDPAKRGKYSPDDSISPMLESALEHCELLDSLGFTPRSPFDLAV